MASEKSSTITESPPARTAWQSGIPIPFVFQGANIYRKFKVTLFGYPLYRRLS